MPRNLTEIKMPERRKIREIAEREHLTRVKAAEQFNITYAAAKRLMHGLPSYDNVNRSLVQREAQARKSNQPRIPVTRATFEDGSVLTVSHGESAAVALDMVNAMARGRQFVLEVVR